MGGGTGGGWIWGVRGIGRGVVGLAEGADAEEFEGVVVDFEVVLLVELGFQLMDGAFGQFDRLATLQAG